MAIVTGAGGGLGRQHALALAARGAKVLVNDLGGAVDGSGATVGAAQAVVDEIRAAGGEALANGASVTDFAAVEAMVQQAIDAWGRVDILVNNAGILRDKSFAKMTHDDFRLVVDVHLMGAAICCVLFRVNLPLALITTLYSNPLTIVPLYVLAFGIGSLILGNGDFDFTPPPDLVGMNPAVWIGDLAAWASTLGKPLFVGLIVLAASLSMLSYLAVRWGWRLWLIRQWRERQRGPR